MQADLQVRSLWRGLPAVRFTFMHFIFIVCYVGFLAIKTGFICTEILFFFSFFGPTKIYLALQIAVQREQRTLLLFYSL